ncbi:MAG: adenylate/guanylate cyclase domain-containing protein [Cyclobacteriaceae bacterium]
MKSLSPKLEHNLSRILPFGIIFLLCGWLFLFIEISATGTSDVDPSTAINLTFSIFIFASIAIFGDVLLVGTIEMILLPDTFREQSFYRKIIFKALMYLIFMLIVITLTFPIAASIEADTNILDSLVWEKYWRFLKSRTLLSTLVQLSFSIVLALIYAEISENLGHSVLINFFTGKYHKPTEEDRIFMFLDMRSSTSLAEKLGHVRYFELLSDYYNSLSNAIIDNHGQVYQYVGDEIVITWTYDKGLDKDCCLNCFFAMRNDLLARSEYFKANYGVEPSFKAGLHMGKVTTGEIGALKKEIMFTGDVLNATARLQSMCDSFGENLLVSKFVIEQLTDPDKFKKAMRFPGILFILLSLSRLSAQPVQEITLDAPWEFKGLDSLSWMPAEVPGSVHTDLLINGLIDDPFYRTNERDQQWIDKKDWEYRIFFDVSDSTLQRDAVELEFDGLDTYAHVYLNDSLILQADNFFRRWTIDVKKLLHAGSNKLYIHFLSPVRVGLQKLHKNGYPLPASNDQSENGGLGNDKVSVFTRKPGYHYGWDWGPRFVTSGIWAPVRLRAWNTFDIRDVYVLQQDISEAKAVVDVEATVESVISGNVDISLYFDEKRLVNEEHLLEKGSNIISVTVEIDQPKLWWTRDLGEPYLYDVRFSVVNENLKLNWSDSIGLRSINLVQEKDGDGESFYFELNGVPVFAKGANYIPQDSFIPRVKDEQYSGIIKSAAAANMNMIRVWGGGFYLWCGNNEIDVAWSQYDANGGWGWKQRYNDQQKTEIWSDYEALFHDLLPAVVDSLSPNISYWPSSPWAGDKKHAGYSTASGDVHYWGVWHGEHAFEEFSNYVGRFMSEFGFQSFPEFRTVQTFTIPADWDIESEVMSAHQRSGIGNLRIRSYMDQYYKVPSDFTDLLYVGQVLQAEGMRMGFEAHRRAMPYCMGTLYWQINDCWPVASWSGMDYYQRWKGLHYFAKNAFEPVLVSPYVENDTLYIQAVSDELNDRNAVLKFQLMDFEGNVIKDFQDEISLPGQTSVRLFQSTLNELISIKDKSDVLLSVELEDGSEILASNIFYFDKVKNLNLPKPGIQVAIDFNENDWHISISSDNLVKNLFLEFEKVDGHFSDNYFDVLPGKEIRIIFIPANDNKYMKDELLMRSIRDTYQ